MHVASYQGSFPLALVERGNEPGYEAKELAAGTSVGVTC